MSSFRTFTARYNGNCEVCGIWIVPGDQVGYDPDGNLIHAECWDPGDYVVPEPTEFNFAQAKGARDK